jgi:outer membrane protein assembly factor BamB
MMNKKRRLIISLLILVCGLSAGAPGAENWPSFRGPAASGISDGFTTPVNWDVQTGKNILWKAPIPGLGHSSCIIWEDKIFVTTAVPEKGQSNLKVGLYGDVTSEDEQELFTWQVYCLDKKTGNVLWVKDSHTGNPKVKRHPKSSHANHTPSTDGKYVVAFFGSEGLYCYDMDGELIWKKDLGLLDWGYFRSPSAQWGGGTSPVIHKDTVILQCDVQKDSFIATFNLKDGSLLWRTARDDVPTWSTPTVYTGAGLEQIIVNGYRHIGGYHLKDGKEIWRMTGGGDIPVPTPVVADGLIYITNAHGRAAPIYAILASAAADISLTGKQTRNAYIVWSKPKAGNYMTTPIVYNGLLYLCADNGRLSCIEAVSGRPRYLERLKADDSKLTSAFSASPVAADDKLYFTGEKGGIYVVQAGAEFKILAVNQMGQTCMATPAVSEGVLYFRTRSKVIAVGEKLANDSP